ncbi:hypothetical protein FQS90_02230 [Enterococcus casseliflavus]|nr:hypothetical protein [Enterococcus casseliflavus]MBO1142981.1 hypothetical protein [Enterococcus casseliflavus]
MIKISFLIKKQVLFEKLIKKFSFVPVDMTNPEKRFTKKNGTIYKYSQKLQAVPFQQFDETCQKKNKKRRNRKFILVIFGIIFFCY